MSDNNPIYHQPIALTGKEFEETVVKILEKFSFKAARTGSHDYGVDIIATKTIKNIVYTFNIQCKYWNSTLGNKPIQEVLAGTLFHDNGGRPVVITNNRFTVEARTYAIKVGVELIGHDDFMLIAETVKSQTKPYFHKEGLLGIILGVITKDPAYIEKAVKKVKVKVPDSKEELKAAIKSDFEQAEEYVKEAAALQQKSAIYHEKAIQLQKEAMLRNLEYG